MVDGGLREKTPAWIRFSGVILKKLNGVLLGVFKERNHCFVCWRPRLILYNSRLKDGRKLGGGISCEPSPREQR